MHIWSNGHIHSTKNPLHKSENNARTGFQRTDGHQKKEEVLRRASTKNKYAGYIRMYINTRQNLLSSVFCKYMRVPRDLNKAYSLKGTH